MNRMLSLSKPMRYINIDLAEQCLQLIDNEQVIFQRLVSTSRNGAGECIGSGCTPRGWLVIKVKIGTNCPINTVFVGRRPTWEIYSPQLQERYPQRDWILTRILWLGGLEPGKNRYRNVDTLRRFIYIHGSPDIVPMGIPESHGCIRMRNRDIIDLYEQVTVGTRVFIT